MKYLWLFVACLFPFEASGNIFVGNGGEGVKWNGRVIVRDLYSEGVREPFFGPTQDSAMQAQLARSGLVAKLALNREKLARKLSDLNRVKKGLGNIVLLTLDKYRIAMVDGELPLVPDGGSLPEEMRVQLAIRRYMQIFISRQRFAALDEEQRIALLVHEALYSLVNISCKMDSCEQFPDSVRKIVGRLFQPNGENNAELKALLDSELALPSGEAVCRELPLAVSARFWKQEGDAHVPSGSALAREAWAYHSPMAEQMFSDTAAFCDSLPSLPGSQLLSLDGEFQYLTISPYVYQSSFGQQQGVRLEVRSLRLKRFWPGSSKESCTEEYRRQLVDWQAILQRRVLDTSILCGT